MISNYPSISTLSKVGAELQGLNPETGAALIQGDGPADFSIITETVLVVSSK